MRLKAIRDEAGFTLVEMMVTMMIMVIVLFALYGIFDMSLRVFSFSNNKIEAVETARVGLERMEREIRAAYPYNKGGIGGAVDSRVLETMARNEIAFGNDTDKPGTTRYKVDASEKIRYKLLEDYDYVTNAENPCDNPGEKCKVYRSVGGGDYRTLIGSVPAPTSPSADDAGLRFTYLDANGVETSVEADVEIVRIELDVVVNEGRDEGKQTLVTEVALRNRGE